MNNEVEELVSSLSLNQILIAILEDQKQISVPTINFFNAKDSNKDLVMDYDENNLSFIFSLKDKSEQ